ncbi:SDR family NAD(P)-dependent oxidoreductase [Sorangium atrum]|uniref:3-oxoacyl-ACP reductase FabG n=1 Tax=Sorangium atrum TaxID=2995308 RepID=A0ABT5CHC7_9BACT|nr:3-oxoacyl-ACP reductase family protein [Sorangium aterium]MDC0684532.1 3-oxoacyl-ACP reductase FabG [Sorangium aterium]
MRLQGKIALVTGSSRGIGRSITVRFAREGADVALTYHKSKEGAEEALAEVEAAGRRGHLFAVDVASVQSVQGLIQEAVARFGRLDVLVNNAGLEKRAPFWEVTEEDYDAVMNTNLKAVFFGSQAMVRHLRESGRPGKIINISSVHEDLPFPHFASYCASKGGVRMLTRTLAVELRGTGITVNAIAPGAIETAINAALLKDREKLSALLDQIPLGRLGKPEDVAGLAVFLASADADYVTGSTYFVDGGLTWNYEEQ